MQKCYLHIGTHKTGTTSIQACAYRNRSSLMRDGYLYPDYLPFFTLKKAVASHHNLARSVVDLDPLLDRRTAQQVVNHWLDTCVSGEVDLFLSAENMSTLEDKRCGGDRRVGYWRSLNELLAGFDVYPILTLRRQDQYLESFYKERVRNIFGYRPVSFDDYFSMRIARGKMTDYITSIESIFSVFGHVNPLDFHELSKDKKLVENFMKQALGIDSSAYEKVGNERPSLSPVATAVKAEVSEHIDTHEQNALFVKWLGSPEFRSLASKYLDVDSKVSLFKHPGQHRHAMDDFAPDNEALSTLYGIRFPTTGNVAEKPPLPDLPQELLALCEDALTSIRMSHPSRAR